MGGKSSAGKSNSDVKKHPKSVEDRLKEADGVQIIRAHVDACVESTTSKLRLAILAMLEEWHPTMSTSGCIASNGYLDKLIHNYMQPLCREIGAKRIAAPLTRKKNIV